jgi:hypothetical protein
MKKLLIAAAIASLSFPASLSAQAEPPPPPVAGGGTFTQCSQGVCRIYYCEGGHCSVIFEYSYLDIDRDR